ncbi:MAG: bifunctional phosphopantothenoylcysteine decarboxylase/phosphopantothenate--cysteine ligase CoaBC [Candidatus Nanopelagicales bacterium]|nr:bifunctional phosphopantothenoylcysteine decarboxylase/phosphopantothenate--cysteine ligase CoaBC [Candidatus Nanopelagicales bacterium]MDZ4250827.1 bifunctional phosphopantothenoylcysteine decarboxylase/phosphopantothenate--cysteine ligase CoaBC [Candidatus Nanopelagicales bacterium]
MGNRGRIVLGVGAGIAAYKACSLLRLLTEGGYDVEVLPTRDSLRFVGAATWAALSGKPVRESLWDGVHEVPHVEIGRWADLVVIAPATANLLSKAAAGVADDLLTSTLLTARCPIVMAPAMHTEMWEHPATVANVKVLRERGCVVLDPAIGRLTGVDSGPGRLPEPESLFETCRAALRAGAGADLAGRVVVVSAGGTREPVDPVRFLGNRSSGRQGYALAAAALARGAQVSLVSANVALVPPAGATLIQVESAEEMREAVLGAALSADAVVMAAAVADFRPAVPAAVKIKKAAGAISAIELTRNADILSELVQRRRDQQVLVGFAAETGAPGRTVLDLAREKLADKVCDLLVVNDVSEGKVFGQADNEVVILGADGSVAETISGSKVDVAHRIWDQVVEVLS